jgi:hypothetical protein
LTLSRIRADNPVHLSRPYLNPTQGGVSHGQPFWIIHGTYQVSVGSCGARSVGSRCRSLQKSADPNWNNSALTYVAISDLVDGKGTQHGYFVNVRADGDRDLGTFEGKVTTVNGMRTLEGTYQETGGTGKFKGITGKSAFKTRMTSPRDAEATYQGT